MSLYRPLDWVMVRAPLLPVEEYRALPAEPADWPVAAAPGTLVPADPSIQRALAVGGGDLLRALEQPPAGDRARARLSQKLQRFLIRMSSRPTPFGLFAGVGLAGWGGRTDLGLAGAPPRVRTRPDMGWLLDFVSTVEHRVEVRRELCWVSNPAAFIRADRVFLSERAPIGDGSLPGQAMSLRATTVVRRALECAREPVPYPRLRAELSTIPGATEEKVARLLDELWEQTLLLTDLRPPLTTAEPARYVVARLAGIPAAADDAAALTELLEAAEAWDALDAEQGAASYPKLVAQANSVHTADTPKGPFQTDLVLPMAGRSINAEVAGEATRAAELMLRMSPWPTGMAHLDAYRDVFIDRYGADREVPLLALLDPEVGLGPPAAPDGSKRDDDRVRARNRALTDLAIGAIRDRRRVVELDEPALAALEVEPLAAERLPASLDISLFVVAESAQAVDAGEFQVVIGPNVGAAAAGRVLGRFATLIGEDAETALRSAADAEAVRRPGRVWAEVSYLPRPGRIANVAIRPLVRGHEVVLDTTPGAPADRVIPLADLVVGLRDGRFVVRWPAAGKEIVPCAGHMLNARTGPPVIRFLDEITRDGSTVPSTFDWGSAAGFPFLPRIQVGRVVLAPARWQLDPRDIASAQAFAAWRERWQPPRHVYLAVADHRLLLDLDAPAQVDQLHAEARGLAAGSRLVLHEALPAPEHAWLPGPGGHYLSELVVPVVLDGSEEEVVVPQRTPAQMSYDRRLRPPGSDWLFAKLYHIPTFEEDVLAGPVRDFCAEAIAAGLAHDWFFMRYADPDPHLRIRWHGDPEVLANRLAPRVLRWGSSLVAKGFCHRLGLDTYDQEVERYGGPAAMTVAEELFAADSVAVLDLLALIDERAVEVDRALLGMSTVDDLLAALGLSEVDREALYRKGVLDRRETAEEYRGRQAELRLVLGDPGWLARQRGGAEVAAILDRRRARVQDVARRLAVLDTLGELGKPPAELARSFVHMHANRLLGLGHPPEQQVLGLLLRTRESLRRAPVQP